MALDATYIAHFEGKLRELYQTQVRRGRGWPAQPPGDTCAPE